MKFLVSRAAGALFLDPGLGKTRIALQAFATLRARGFAKRALVLAPLKPLFLTWPSEITKWKFNLTFSLLHDDAKTFGVDPAYPGFKPGDRMFQWDRETDIDLLNYDGLSWLVGKHGSEIADRYDVLILDESTKIKNSQTLRFKLLKGIFGTFKRRYALTGSPTPNGLIDLFGQIYALDLGRALGRFITHYRMSYFYPSGYGGYEWNLQPGAEKRIYDRLSPKKETPDLPVLVLRLSAEEELKQSKPIVVDRPVKLPASAMKIYAKLQDEMIVQIKNREVTAVNAAVVTQKCRQLAYGRIYADETPEDFDSGKRRVIKVHSAKIEDLQDLIEELSGQPLLVGYEFHHDLAALREAFPHAKVFDSTTKMAEQKKIETDWNAGRVELLLAQMTSASRGLNLQEGPGHALYYFSLTWNLEDYDQFWQRVGRQGQRKRVMIYRPVAVDTVDEDLVGALGRKAKTQDDLFSALRARYH